MKIMSNKSGLNLIMLRKGLFLITWRCNRKCILIERAILNVVKVGVSTDCELRYLGLDTIQYTLLLSN